MNNDIPSAQNGFFPGTGRIKEEPLFFAKVKDICNKQVVVCAPDTPVTEAAGLMKKSNISGIIVCDRTVPVGVVTDRDFRNKIVSAGLNSADLRIHAIMSFPLISIQEASPLFEAVYLMSRHNIHRLAVIDEMGSLTGIITDTDIIKFHTNTPLYFIRDLEKANTINDLLLLHKKTYELIVFLVKAGVRMRDLVRLVSYLNDSVILRMIDIMVREEYIPLPPFAFLVLGSEGRREQTLKTDQDNAIIYPDNMSAAEIKMLEQFSRKLIDGLIAIGVPPCPGGIMAKNPQWRRSQGEWISVIKDWVSAPTPENILNYAMFSDLRTVYGKEYFEKAVKDKIAALVRETPVFLAHLAATVLRFPPPLGLFGGVRTETGGKHWGKLDIKKAGIFALTEGIKVLALEHGIMNGGTRDKIVELMDRGVMSSDILLEIEDSFNFLVYVRLRSQIADIGKGDEPTNYIDPRQLNHVEKGRLKASLKVVKDFQKYLKDHYRLEFITG